MKLLNPELFISAVGGKAFLQSFPIVIMLHLHQRVKPPPAREVAILFKVKYSD